MEIKYEPRFAKDYHDLKGDAEYPMFVATALGIKRSYDDWVPVRQFGKFMEICKKYGLHVETDVVFADPGNRNDVIGSETITTTFARGLRFTGKEDGLVHVFVARKKEDALYAKKFGWYPVVVGNRMVHKLHVDHMRFGLALRFPACCVDFFRKYNNWNLYSNPYEAFKQTRKPDYRCNNFLMDHSLYYTHHIPCRYDCPETVKYVSKLEAAFEKVEPGFVREAKRFLSMPLLVFGERNFMIFDGAFDKGVIRYRDTMYFSNQTRPEDSVDFFAHVRDGNRIEDGEQIRIFRDDKLVHTVEKQPRWFFLGFS